MNRQEFTKLVNSHTRGVLIVKLTASWCQPCQRIRGLVANLYRDAPTHITMIELDIDGSPDVYTFLKSKRVVGGVPSLLAYHGAEERGDHSYLPDDLVSGSDPSKITRFFNRQSSEKQ